MDNLFPPITDLIPHRPPIVMVDSVIGCDGKHTMTQYLVPQEGSFIEEGYLNEMGLIENMAQSSFIFLSYLKNQQEALLPDQGNAIGYISSILSLEVTKRPQVGQLLQTQLMTELVFSSEFLKICKITGDIRVGENLIFKATMNMLLQSQAE